jgi:hypothetical protein
MCSHKLGLRGFVHARRGPFVLAKGLKTIIALRWLSEYPAMLVNSGGCATRFAQTVLALYPESTALLGHLRRRLKAKKGK